MLQLNHVYIKDKNKDILTDCTYQFAEDNIYVIVGDPDDFIAFFNCVKGEKKTHSGEIVTWDSVEKFNSSDDSLMPEMMTGEEYLGFLVRVTGKKLSVEELMKKSGIQREEMTYLLEKASPEIKAKLRFASMIASDAYINTFGEPFPEKELFCEYMNRMNEDKIFLLGVSEENEARDLALACGARLLKIERGSFSDEI